MSLKLLFLGAISFYMGDILNGIKIHVYYYNDTFGTNNFNFLGRKPI
jgi:hypothetical protein